ncbi:hypothetical protein [Paraburkholderia sp. Ac-20347]|uniref:hypothetical protein n=1 Tax=Paraburkholderia sp. Ac-20347 TaxID=2703892 RepID=UPI0019822F60|nr:hypothetical protein [Paraburkholderia sp. Ac-20347]MBN3812229.1 hypothetical protein [Paraburkholderia sp. Ac-20347]
MKRNSNGITMKQRHLFVSLSIAFSTIAASAFGASTVPPAMLNPSGSTAGQAIISTGASSAPVWGAVPLTGITGTLAIANGGTGAATQAAALTNLLGSSAIPVANGGTGASTAATARSNLGTAASGANSDITSLTGLTTPLSLTQGGTGATTAAAAQTSLGLGTAATYATGTSGSTVPLLSGANTWSAAQTFSSTITPTGGITGRTSGAAAASGIVGQPVNVTTTGTSLTTATAANCTSLSIAAGTWLVWGQVTFAPGGTITETNIAAGVSTTSATFSSGTVQTIQFGSGISTTLGQSIMATPQVLNLSAATSVYLVGSASFSGATLTCSGYLYGVRIA